MNAETGPTNSTESRVRLAKAVAHAAHLLPAQGPITVFIHHNTLHAFEDLPFEEAVRHGANVFGCQPYLSEERFREALARGRIRFPDLQAVLADELGERSDEPLPPRGTRIGLRLAMLQNPLPSGTPSEIRWLLEESDAFRRVWTGTSAAEHAKLIAETRHWVMRDLRSWDGTARETPEWLPALFRKYGEYRIGEWPESTWEAFSLDALWGICRAGVGSVPHGQPRSGPPVRHCDLLRAATGIDIDQSVNAVLIRFCAAFLDQGVSQWPLPDRDRGFVQSFCTLYRNAAGPPDLWFRGVSSELAKIQDAGTDGLDLLANALHELGVEEPEWEEYLSATLLALRGWGGMIHISEQRPDRFAFPSPPGSLVGFLAVRLVLERIALSHFARDLAGEGGTPAGLRSTLHARFVPPPSPDLDARTVPVFLLAQSFGWTPEELFRLSRDDWSVLIGEMESFDSVERRRVFHLAYERRFREQSLDALALHLPQPVVARPRFQAITCIDEREESFRRQLEELAPDCETFGTAGFFAVVMYFRGVAEAHYTPLCPVVVTPKHWVEERPEEAEEEQNRRTRRIRRALGRTSHQFHMGTRGFAIGAVITGGLGVLATFPLVARVMFPGLTARLRKRMGSIVTAPQKTRLRLERKDTNPGPEGGGVGFSVEEMTGIAERVLRDIGLTRNFARIVFTIGHGSHSMNNPHESAHDCGACGGAVGGPNGRAIAQILNDPRVRTGLSARGIAIPADTVFVGGLHNTCNEYVKFADTDLIPESHRAEYEAGRASIDASVLRNAHERARRFESASLDISPNSAQLHMDARAEDLAQVRPEWGHATNALCIVGRRERTRGLFLDRRAFLASYDPTQDTPDAAVLTRTLLAVFPVCGGINLEYYFSHVDPTGYGCGTKLPHNITSLLGVMDGAASDLRTGLPWQMVEIHEPVRLLIVCETTPDIMLGIMAKHPVIGTMAEKRWVQLAVLDPASQVIREYRHGGFHEYRPRSSRLPVSASSVEWYHGWREHLEFAEIGRRTRSEAT